MYFLWIKNIEIFSDFSRVAISMLSGENGILRQAADAKIQTELKSEEEQVKLAAQAALTAGHGM